MSGPVTTLTSRQVDILLRGLERYETADLPAEENLKGGRLTALRQDLHTLRNALNRSETVTITER